LSLERPPALRWLALERPEGPQIARVGDHGLHGLEAERAHQLSLEVRGANVDLIEHPPEQVRLVRIAEPSDDRTRRESRDEAADRVRASDRDDLDTFGGEVSTSASSQHLERDAVADALHCDNHV
jgi:hypothetical protein